MGVPLIGELQVILSEAVGQGGAVHTPVHDPALEHLPSSLVVSPTPGHLIGRRSRRLLIPLGWKQDEWHELAGNRKELEVADQKEYKARSWLQRGDPWIRQFSIPALGAAFTSFLPAA